MGNESVQRRDDSRTDFFCAAICPVFIFDIQTVISKTPRNVTRYVPPCVNLYIMWSGFSAQIKTY